MSEQVKIWRNADTGATVTLHTDAYGAHRIGAIVAGAAHLAPEPTGDREWAESLANGLALTLGASLHVACGPYCCCERCERAAYADAPAPVQMASPLPAELQAPASGLARGTSLTRLSPELHAKLVEAATPSLGGTNTLRRGEAGRTKCATFTQLRALARRGLVELDNAVMPTLGVLTALGRRTALGELTTIASA